MSDPEYMTDAENDVLDAGERFAADWAALQRAVQANWPFDRCRPLYLRTEHAKDQLAAAALRAAGYPINDLQTDRCWVE